MFHFGQDTVLSKKPLCYSLGAGVKREAQGLGIGGIFLPPGPEHSSSSPGDEEGRGAAQVGAVDLTQSAADHQVQLLGTS